MTAQVQVSSVSQDFHGEVSYILATFSTSQEDGRLVRLRGADVPVGVHGRLKFYLVPDFFLVEDKSPVYLLL